LLLRQNQELSTQNKKLSTQIQQQFSHISTLEQERNKLQEELLILEQKHQLTKDELDCLRHQIFGRKSERFIGMDPAQLTLELEGMVEAMRKEETEQVSYTRKKSGKKERQGHSRMPIPAHLRREEITIEPENVPEGSKKIGEEVTEVMEYKKAEIYVKKYIRPKYVLPKEEGVVIGLLPSLPIPKGNAGPSLLSHILIGKYVDHLPVYRQQKQFKRLGVEISDKTICGWVAASCELLLPLYEKLMQNVQRSGYIQADETPIKVLDKNKKGDTHKGYYWVYHSPITKAVCFQYRKGRGREGPKEFLKDFQGPYRLMAGMCMIGLKSAMALRFWVALPMCAESLRKHRIMTKPGQRMYCQKYRSFTLPSGRPEMKGLIIMGGKNCATKHPSQY
jgi:transposase